MASSRRTARESWLAVVLFASFCVIFATEWLTPRTHPLGTATPFVLNVLAFAALTSLAVAVTNRALFSIAMVTSLYELVVLCNRLKIRYLSTPVHPADFFVLSNVFLVDLFPKWAWVAGF